MALEVPAERREWMASQAELLLLRQALSHCQPSVVALDSRVRQTQKMGEAGAEQAQVVLARQVEQTLVAKVATQLFKVNPRANH